MPASATRLALMALLLAPAVTAQADENLRFKFKADQTLRYEFVQAMKMDLEIAGRNNETEMTQTMEMTWNVKKVDDKGTATIEQTIDRIGAKISGPGVNIEYDSAKKETAKQENPQAQQLVKLFEVLQGARITQELTALGEVKNVTLPEGLSDKLKEAVAGGGGGNTLFSEESIKNLSSQSGLKLPEGGVQVGKAWETTTEVPAPPLGSIKTVNTYTLKPAAAGGNREIDVAGKLTLEKSADIPAEIALEAAPIAGVIHFDEANGNIADSKVDQEFTMTLSANGQKLVQKVNQTITLKRLP